MAIKTALFQSCAFTALVLANTATAQDVSYTLYGTPGLIEMPSARSETDAGIAASLTGFGFQQRANFTFQITPRLSGTFRYAGIQDRGPGLEDSFDRSFDLRYRVIDESAYIPAIAVGLQDFLGTGLLSSEYIVASKKIGDTIDVTAGIGWGRFGSRNGFTNPLGALDAAFETRPIRDAGVGGDIEAEQFFRGDAAFFGGIEYAYSDKLRLKAEYSSDAYTRETAMGALDNRTPLNVGLTYRYSSDVEMSLAYLHGSEIAAGVTLKLNPRTRAVPSGLETAPPPVRVRAADARAAASWDNVANATATLRDQLDAQGITLDAIEITGTTARLRYTNTAFRSEAQAMGRAARVLTQSLPNNVETLVLEPMQRGIPLSATRLRRSDLEQLETSATGAADILNRATITDAGGSAGLTAVARTGSPFTWGIGPYAQLIVFNGNAPVQVDVGVDLKGRYEITPNLVVQGSIRQSLLGKRDLADEFETPNNYPDVRTDARFYGRDGTPVISSLQLAHYGRPGPDLYSRVSLGYLEAMYGGVSAEVLWKPVDSDFALGAEVNYVMQRDYDMLFGFRDFDTVTGHLSGYYSFDNGFHAQVDVGRYLAGDWGATFALDREFENGWKVGAYFTLTDMPFDQFGEGSFDKGIRITVPNDYFTGNASRSEVNTQLSSLTRDGGAKLNVDGRLYEVVRDGHTGGYMGDTWGRFWR